MHTNFDTMNEFKFRKSSSLFTSNSWICFCRNHFMNQTRKFAHYQYYYIYRRSRLMHNRKQNRNHPNTKFFSIENFSKDVIFRQNEIIRTRNFSRCYEFDFATFFVTWNSFEHELFAFWCVSHQTIWFDFASLFERIDMIWFEKSLSSWFSHLANSNWSKRLQKSTDAFFFQWFFDQVVYRVCWNFDDIMIEISCEFVTLQKSSWKENLLRCFERQFSRERFNRIELLQNKCFQKNVSSTLKSLIVSTFVITIHVVASAHSSRKLRNFLLLRLYILREDEL